MNHKRRNINDGIRAFWIACLLWMILMVALTCQTPRNGSGVSANVPISTAVGAGDDDKVARHFDVKAKGESIVIITYHSNDQPEAIDTIYGRKWEEILEILMSRDSIKKQ